MPITTLKHFAVAGTLAALTLLPAPRAAHAGDDPQDTPTTALAPAAALPAPKLGGYVQVRETAQDGPGLTATINRARLSADGALPNRFTYRVLVEYEAGGNAKTAAAVSLREAYARWTYAPFALQFGQFKTPFTREYLVPVSALETLDLPVVVDSLAPKYDIGATAEASWRGNATLTLGVFNGEGQNIPANRDSQVVAIARATVRALPQVTFGGSLARYSPDSLRYGGDAAIEQCGFSLRGELVGQRRRGRTRDDQGWYVFAGYRALPWLQFVARQEDYQRPALGTKRRLSSSMGGVTFDLAGGRTRILTEFISSVAGAPRVRRGTLAAQLQVKF